MDEVTIFELDKRFLILLTKSIGLKKVQFFHIFSAQILNTVSGVLSLSTPARVPLWIIHRSRCPFLSAGLDQSESYNNAEINDDEFGVIRLRSTKLWESIRKEVRNSE